MVIKAAFAPCDHRAPDFIWSDDAFVNFPESQALRAAQRAETLAVILPFPAKVLCSAT